MRAVAPFWTQGTSLSGTCTECAALAVMGALELKDWARIGEISAIKWNAPDWWFGLLAGVLFGHYIALSIVDGIFQPSSDTKNWIGVSSFNANLIVVQVRSWRLRSKNPPAPTDESPTTPKRNFISIRVPTEFASMRESVPTQQKEIKRLHVLPRQLRHNKALSRLPSNAYHPAGAALSDRDLASLPSAFIRYN